MVLERIVFRREHKKCQKKTGATHIAADNGHPLNWALPEGAISRFGRGSVDGDGSIAGWYIPRSRNQNWVMVV